MTAKFVLSAVLAGVIAAGASVAAQANDAKPAEGKCFGVAEAGKNDCATAKHACAGKSVDAKDASEFVKATKEDCEKKGGKFEAAAAK